MSVWWRWLRWLRWRWRRMMMMMCVFIQFISVLSSLNRILIQFCAGESHTEQIARDKGPENDEIDICLPKNRIKPEHDFCVTMGASVFFTLSFIEQICDSGPLTHPDICSMLTIWLTPLVVYHLLITLLLILIQMGTTNHNNNSNSRKWYWFVICNAGRTTENEYEWLGGWHNLMIKMIISVLDFLLYRPH